ncbi:MAG TPA: metal-dependent hydrolase [Herpetosiphonaceae bacterium]
MSGFQTHLIIGAVGGLGLARWLDHTQVLPLPSGVWQLGAPIIPLGLTGLGIILGSALLNLWPDLDEPGSWMSRRLKAAVALIAAPLVGLVGYALAAQGRLPMRPEGAAVVGLLLGALLVGPLLGWLLLRLIRIGAGGHRRLTHSLVLGGVLAALAVALWRNGQPIWALVPAALVGSQWLHLCGDLVTVAGVPLLHPISARDFGLPRPLAVVGEPLITVVALLVGSWLLWGMAA